MSQSYVDITYPEVVNYNPDPNALKVRFIYDVLTVYNISLNSEGTLSLLIVANNGESAFLPELVRSHIYSQVVFGQARKFVLVGPDGQLRYNTAVENNVIVIFNKADDITKVQLVLYDEGRIIFRATDLLNNKMLFG